MSKFFRTKEELIVRYGNDDEIIADGSYSTVFKTDKGYAVKSHCRSDTDDDCHFLREIAVLQCLSHPNIVRLLGVGRGGSYRMIYMKYASETLQDYIVDLEMDTPRSRTPQWYLYQLLRAIEYCHRHDIIHRDIKPQNVLLFENGRLQLADFGLARAFSTSGQVCTGDMVTLWWRAPEILLGATRYSCLVDMWSFGVIMLNIILRKNPLKGRTVNEQIHKICDFFGTPTKDVWPGLSQLPDAKRVYPNCSRKPIRAEPVALDLLQKLLAWEPYRISASDALSHCYFDSARYQIERLWPGKPNSIKLDISPKPTSFSTQRRQTLFDWLWEVKESRKFCWNTLFLAFNIFDRYLLRNPTIAKKDIQGYGIAAILISSKLQEVRPLRIEKCVYLCADRYTSSQICNYEFEILKALEFRVLSNPFFYVTPRDEKEWLYLTAMYLNYVWATAWTSTEFMQVLQDYLDGKEAVLVSASELKNYFETLTGAAGDKVKSIANS